MPKKLSMRPQAVARRKKIAQAKKADMIVIPAPPQPQLDAVAPVPPENPDTERARAITFPSLRATLGALIAGGLVVGAGAYGLNKVGTDYAREITDISGATTIPSVPANLLPLPPLTSRFSNAPNPYILSRGDVGRFGFVPVTSGRI